MKSPTARRIIALVLGVAMLGSTALVLTAQSPDAPTTAPSTAPAGADPRAAMMEIQQAAMEMQAALGSPDVVTDPVKRDAAAAKVLPPLKRMIAAAKKLESSGAGPEMTEQAQQMQMQFNVMAATFGDAEARQALETVAQAGGADQRATGAASLLLVDWFRSDKDAAKQAEILDKADALAKANPDSDAVTEILMAMSQVGAANDEVEDRAEKIASAMSSGVAQQAKARAEAKGKLEKTEGQPLVITG